MLRIPGTPAQSHPLAKPRAGCLRFQRNSCVPKYKTLIQFYQLSPQNLSSGEKEPEFPEGGGQEEALGGHRLDEHLTLHSRSRTDHNTTCNNAVSKGGHPASEEEGIFSSSKSKQAAEPKTCIELYCNGPDTVGTQVQGRNRAQHGSPVFPRGDPILSNPLALQKGREVGIRRDILESRKLFVNQ